MIFLIKRAIIIKDLSLLYGRGAINAMRKVRAA